MALFKKKILAPSTYRVNGEDVTLDAGHFSKWVRNFQKLRKSGYRLPAPFYHDKRAEPIRLKPNQKDVDAYNNGGWWDRLWVSKRDGALWGEVDVPDEAKAKKLTSGEIVEVSPAIRAKYETNDLGTLEDVITHIALVTQPVAGNQEPFKIAAARCFARSMLADPTEDDDDDDDDGWDFQIAESGKNTASKGAASKAPAAKAQKKGGVVVKPTNMPEQEMEAPEAATAGIEEALEILKELGILLPKDTDENNFIERLVTAGYAVRGSGKGQMREQVQPPQHGASFSREGDMAEKTPATTETPSLTPEQQMELSRYKSTKAWAERVATKSITKRIAALKLPADFRAKHIDPLLAKHELMFSKDGEIIPGVLDIMLDSLEEFKPAPPEKKPSPFFMSRQVGGPEGGEIQDPPNEPDNAPQSDAEIDELIGSIPAFNARMG